MIALSVLILILWLHFVADFVFQSDRVAKGKSTSVKVLIEHVAIYAIPFIVISPLYALINSVLHFFVDCVSSRIAKQMWIKEKRHWFFVTIGADQALHLTCLVWTYVIFKDSGLL